MSSVAISHASHCYALASVPTPVLVRRLETLAGHELHTDADVLAHIAELDVREEYLRLGFHSMQEYCVRRLRMSEDRANKRIRACRTALAYPAIFEMISDGRLSLSAVLMLKTRLTPENADALLAEAASLPNEALEFMLARRFPELGAGADEPTLDLICGIAGDSGVEVAARPLPVPPDSANGTNSIGPLAAGDKARSAVPNRPALFVRFRPLSGECVAIEGRLSMEAHEHFKHVRALASHAVPSGNPALVIEYALKLAARLLDRQKFGKGVRTRPSHGEPNGRHVPAAIRQAVCERDGGRCTFTAADGTRCGGESHLELDHIVPFAKGGKTTVENLRLLCARHNRLEAKREFGAEFVEARIEQARAEAVRARQRKAKRTGANALQTVAAEGNSYCPQATDDAVLSAAAAAPQADHPADAGKPASGARSAPDPVESDVLAALQSVRFTLAEARHGVQLTAHMGGATAEQRVRVALQHLSRVHAHRIKPASGDS